jgi:hypothetical protein
MTPFNSEMNHWQRQWLSDRLHKKNSNPSPPPINNAVVINKPKRPRQRKPKPEAGK